MTFKITAEKRNGIIQVNTNIKGWTNEELAFIVNNLIDTIYEVRDKPSNGALSKGAKKA